MDSKVERKNTSYRAKYDTKTLSIYFANDFNNQFTDEIYNALNEEDEVTLHVTYFTKEIRSVFLTKNNITLQNSTSEVYIQVILALGMILFSAFLMKKNFYTFRNYLYIALLLIMGIINLTRIIKHLL